MVEHTVKLGYRNSSNIGLIFKQKATIRVISNFKNSFLDFSKKKVVYENWI